MTRVPPPPDDAAMLRLDDHYAAAVAAASVPGAAWGVVLGGHLVHSGAIGHATLPGGPVPTSTTRFRIASMTKSFTAAAVLALRDDGLLGLDDPVVRYVPEVAGLVSPTSDAPPITVRHLLSMDSGLATDDPWADRHLDLDRRAFAAVLVGGVAFAATPGTVFEYSNLGYGILGRIVEQAGGSALRAVVEDRFLRPLGMADTGWDVPAGDAVAAGYRLLDGEAVHDGEPLGHGEIAAMGGLWSTVEDLARWVAFFLDAFPARDGDDDGPLRRSTRREMQRVWRSIPVTIDRSAPGGRLRLGASGYGAGLVAHDDEALGQSIAHSGGLPGFGSNMRWIPERQLGVVALGNLRYAPMAAANRDVLEMLAAEGHLDRIAPRCERPVEPVLRDVIDRLVSLLNDWDDGRTALLFADNVELDERLERRAAEAAALVERCGELSVRSLKATRATSATIDLVGERGAVRCTVQLAPTVPARVQSYTFATMPT